MKLEKESLTILGEALERLDGGFAELPDVNVQYDKDDLRDVLLEVADRMQDNYPYFHPYYAGQMLKPPHPVARLAYMLASSDGRRTWDTCVPAARWRTSRPSGWRESSTRAGKSWPPTRPTTPTAGYPMCCNWTSRLSRAIPAHGWT